MRINYILKSIRIDSIIKDQLYDEKKSFNELESSR